MSSGTEYVKKSLFDIVSKKANDNYKKLKKSLKENEKLKKEMKLRYFKHDRLRNDYEELKKENELQKGSLLFVSDQQKKMDFVMRNMGAAYKKLCEENEKLKKENEKLKKDNIQLSKDADYDINNLENEQEKLVGQIQEYCTEMEHMKKWGLGASGGDNG